MILHKINLMPDGEAEYWQNVVIKFAYFRDRHEPMYLHLDRQSSAIPYIVT